MPKLLLDLRFLARERTAYSPHSIRVDDALYSGISTRDGDERTNAQGRHVERQTAPSFPARIVDATIHVQAHERRDDLLRG